MNDEKVTLAHGAGGKASRRLVEKVIKKYFSNEILNSLDDAALLPGLTGKTAVTTDSFVVSPLFFSGGDIGKLAVCGTVNDLAAMGAKPLYITCGMIIEEGLPVSDFEKILISMKKTAEEAGVIIVAGDTKVVEKGKADGIFINTAGIGAVIDPEKNISSASVKPGDVVIITGNIGEHEAAILKDREGIGFEAEISSDCAPLNTLTEELINAGINIHAMRDPTRGGLSAVLNEIAESSSVKFVIDEEKIPVSETVRSAAGLLGLEILDMANEGKLVIMVGREDGQKALEIIKKNKYGRNASVAGSAEEPSGRPSVILRTVSGGERIVIMSEGGQLPRIC